MSKQLDTELTIEALAYLRDQPDMVGITARRLDELVRDLQSGECELHYCSEPERGEQDHPWAVVLIVAIICATVLLALGSFPT